MTRQNVRFDVCNHSNTLLMIFINETLRIGKAMRIEGESVASLRLYLCHCVSARQLKGGTRNVMLSHLPRKVEKCFVCRWIIKHGVLHSSRNISKCPPGQK